MLSVFNSWLAVLASSAALLLSAVPARAQSETALRWIEREATPYSARALPTTRRPRYCRDRGELDLHGLGEISVAPSGAVWLVRESGPVLRSSGVDQPFTEVPLDCPSASSHTPRGQCDRVTFFTEDVAIATGYAGDRRNTYFWTGDGGRSWEARQFVDGRGGWIYEAFTTAAGEAWMGGSAGTMYHSQDFGRTWTGLTAPFDGSVRLWSIYMVSPQRGIVGGLMNGIRVTRDGGQTWRTVPTPVDQGAAHARTTTDTRVRVAWIGDSLLAQQGGRVFRSAVDPVRWQPIARFVDFAVARDGSHVFAVDAQGRVSELDASLSARRVPGARLPHPAIDMRVEAGALFVLDQSNGLHRFGGAGNVSSAATRSGSPETIESVRRVGSFLLGLSAHMIHLSADGGASWCGAATSETRLMGLTATSDTHAIVWGTGGVHRFNARTGRLRTLHALGGASVSGVHVTQGSWLAATARDGGAIALWRTTDRGRRWTRLDTWSGPGIATFVPVSDESVLAWSFDQSLRRISSRGSTPVESLGAPARLEMPCCHSGYFATEREGYVRGYVHHMGDQVYATTDGGHRWTRRPGADFPYERVVPTARGSLAVVGGSFDNRTTSHRELHLLEHVTRRTVYQAPEAISDVSVDHRGRILVELDPTPGATFEIEGRRWLELSPP